MRVQFWGVRGSIPTPLRPCDVEAKTISIAEEVVKAGITDSDDVARYIRKNYSMLQRATVGGNTTCVTAEWEDSLAIIDAGSGIRQLGATLMDGPCGRGGCELHLFFTHTHWDHIQGLPFFAPLFQRNIVHIHGCHPELEQRLRYQQHTDFFPVSLDAFLAELVFHQHEPDVPIELPHGATATPHRLDHPGDCFGYRIEYDGRSMVMATDSEQKPGADNSHVLEFFKDAGLVIFDSQYTLEESIIKEDWGHSSAIVGVQLAAQANVERLALFHHEPSYPDAFIHSLLLKARTYRDVNYPDTDLKIFVATEGEAVTF